MTADSVLTRFVTTPDGFCDSRKPKFSMIVFGLEADVSHFTGLHSVDAFPGRRLNVARKECRRLSY
jgi:hypothetical protein